MVETVLELCVGTVGAQSVGEYTMEQMNKYVSSAWVFINCFLEVIVLN